jgi:hypothetical protein
MAKIKGMPRADAVGFRYKPRETSWAKENSAETNNALRREFENIATITQEAVIGTNKAISALTGAIEDNAEAIEEVNDRVGLVQIDPNDKKPEYLVDKIKIGPGLVQTFGNDENGSFMFLDLRYPQSDLIVVVKDFNTLLNPDGSEKLGEDEKLICSFAHPIPNEHYIFEVYRPLEIYDNNTVDTWPDGTTRGRYQIRWHNVEQKKANYFSIRFHQPEWGTVVLYGSRSVFRL